MEKPTHRARLAHSARIEAQRLAFGPVAFHVALVLRDNGLLQEIARAGAEGLSAEVAAERAGVTAFAGKMLLECGLGSGLVRERSPGQFVLGDVGYFVLNDEMTRVNMNFVRDVCYAGMANLAEATQNGTPAGLKELGEWTTIYEGLSALPPGVQDSWFEFDHFYSDAAFPAAFPIVFSDKPRRLLDVGGNTAKWALYCAQHNDAVQITIADLPGQLALARGNVEKAQFSHRVDFCPVDLLSEDLQFPEQQDAVWMSQLLVCFSEAEIARIVERALAALCPSGSLFIMDNFWDQQDHTVSSYVIQQTSPYFACLANGNSRMYRSTDFIRAVEAGGGRVVNQHRSLGFGHTLLRCVPASRA